VGTETANESGVIRLFELGFITGGYNKAIALLKAGAFMVVPSAPSLVILEQDPDYRQAMRGSDFAIPDSGFMLLLLKLFKGISIQKLSGLEFLRCFLKEEMLRQQPCVFLVNPNEQEQRANHHYLQSLGIQITGQDHYIAPLYGQGSIADDKLLSVINARRPRFVLINLGGGVQERLGYFLKTHLDYQPGIICTGAAIAFLTGKQVEIPGIVDRLYLGWLMRCLSKPSVYVPRYLGALRLVGMVWKTEVVRGEG